MKIILKNKGYYWNLKNFYRFPTPHFTFIWISSSLPLFAIKQSFLLSQLYHIVLSLHWLSYLYPCHGCFTTPHCNRPLLILYPFCGCLLLVTMSLQYHFSSTCYNFLLIIIIAIVFYLSLHILVIFFSSNIILVNITSPIIVVIISSFSQLSSPCPYYYYFPCCDQQHAFPCLSTS